MNKKLLVAFCLTLTVSHVNFGMNHQPEPNDNWSGWSEPPHKEGGAESSGEQYTRNLPQYLDPDETNDEETGHQVKQKQVHASWLTRRNVVIGGGLSVLASALVVAGKVYVDYKKDKFEAEQIKQFIQHINDSCLDMVQAAEQLGDANSEGESAVLSAIYAYAQKHDFAELALNQTFFQLGAFALMLQDIQARKDHFVNWYVYDERVAAWIVAFEKIRTLLKNKYSEQMQKEAAIFHAMLSIQHKNSL